MVGSQNFDMGKNTEKTLLGGEIRGASIIEKFAEFTAPTRKRFDHFSSVSECLPSCVPAALRVLSVNIGSW
jgi:hypothetical protein